MNKNYRLKYIKDGELKAAIYLKKQALSHFLEKLTVSYTRREFPTKETFAFERVVPKKETFTFEEVREIISEFMSICSEYIAERVEK